MLYKATNRKGNKMNCISIEINTEAISRKPALIIGAIPENKKPAQKTMSSIDELRYEIANVVYQAFTASSLEVPFPSFVFCK